MNSLRQFLDTIRQHRENDIVEINETVSRNQQMTAYWEEFRHLNNPILMFNRVEDSPYPVVTNLFSTLERIGYMLGTDAEGIFDRWNKRIQARIEPEVLDNRRDAPVYKEIHLNGEWNLNQIPIPRYFQQDAGSYITAGIVVAADPEDGILNLSFARMQQKDNETFGISVHSRGNLWEYLEKATSTGQDHLNVSVVVGCHPLFHLAAATRTRDEYPLTGALAEQPVQLVPCETNDLLVPAGAEFVLEGRILTDEHNDEGPFSEYTGYVTGRSTRNVLKLDAVTHRDNPIFHGIIPSNSSEHLLLGGVTKQATVYREVCDSFPRVSGIRWPTWGCHFVAIVSIDKTGEEGIQNRVAYKLMAEDYYLKYVIVVEDDVDIHVDQDVLWAVATRSQPEHALEILRHTDGNALDPSQREEGITSRAIIDATTPPHMGEFERPSIAPEIKAEISKRDLGES